MATHNNEPGMAHIKSEYILLDYKPTVDTEYITQEVKEQLEEDTREEEDHRDGPPNKKLKLRGRNKNRPKSVIRLQDEEKFCPAIIQNRECTYGNSCKFSHDKSAFMWKKPPDLKGRCYLYDTYGRCDYGIACRYAGCHLNENLDNLTKEERTCPRERADRTKNAMKKDLQVLLWKRKYDFSKSNRTLEMVCPGNNSLKEKDKVDYFNKKTVVESGVKIGSDGVVRLKPREQKTIDFSNKLYLAPLTTVGNLPFRRICKEYGADITCGEMAVGTNLLQGKQAEWSLIKRHESEDIFGVQLCGAFPDSMTRCAQVISENMDVDFIDINCGCPIDLIFNRGEGSALMSRLSKFEQIVKGMKTVLDVPLTCKIRTGIYSDKNTAHTLVPQLRDWGCSLTTIHGRSRVQRYTKSADWDYISQVAKAASPMPVFGNGDILSFEEANERREQTGVSGVMLARGALIKPWLFTEIKQQRHWDISSHERFEMLKRFTNYGLDHWGSDHIGVENTRRFMLEWLSFLYRYIPVGLLERVPQKINERPPYYKGRDDLETMMASPNCGDWIKISEMLLGPVPQGFSFLPKHKANAYK